MTDPDAKVEDDVPEPSTQSEAQAVADVTEEQQRETQSASCRLQHPDRCCLMIERYGVWYPCWREAGHAGHHATRTEEDALAKLTNPPEDDGKPRKPQGKGKPKK